VPGVEGAQSSSWSTRKYRRGSAYSTSYQTGQNLLADELRARLSRPLEPERGHPEGVLPWRGGRARRSF
jgi:hypothetical protein